MVSSEQMASYSKKPANANIVEKIIEDHNQAMRKDMASEITGGSRSFAITNVITFKAIQALIDTEVKAAFEAGFRVFEVEPYSQEMVDSCYDTWKWKESTANKESSE